MRFGSIYLGALLISACAAPKAPAKVAEKPKIEVSVDLTQQGTFCDVVGDHFICAIDYPDRTDAFAIGDSKGQAYCVCSVEYKNGDALFMKDISCNRKVDQYLEVRVGVGERLNRDDNLKRFEKEFDPICRDLRKRVLGEE